MGLNGGNEPTVRGMKEQVTISSLLIGLAIAVAGLTIYNVWVKAPETYANKMEVSELKADINKRLDENCIRQNEILRTQQLILQRLPRSGDHD